MQALAQILGDLDQYEPPEVLPNGDVILRRKPPPPPRVDAPGPEVDL
jgi:hypothetical protein